MDTGEDPNADGITGCNGSGFTGEPDGKSLHPVRRSIRTTFRLSDQAEALLKFLSDCQGIPEREILERHTSDLYAEPHNSPLLVDILKKAKGALSQENTQRRTHLVTEETIDMLKRLCSRHDVSRDELVEQIIHLAKDRYRERTKQTVNQLTEVQALYEDFFDDLTDRCSEFNHKIRALLEGTDVGRFAVGDAAALLEDDLHSRIPREIERCQEILRWIFWLGLSAAEQAKRLKLTEEEERTFGKL